MPLAKSVTVKATGKTYKVNQDIGKTVRPYKNYKNLASSVSTALKKAKGKLS